MAKYYGVFSTAVVTYDEGGSEAKPATSCRQSGEGIPGWGQAEPDKDAQLGMNRACRGVSEAASETTYYTLQGCYLWEGTPIPLPGSVTLTAGRLLPFSFLLDEGAENSCIQGSHEGSRT